MKGLSTRPKAVSHGPNLTKLKKKRIRTWSSDSGCDVANEYSEQMLCSMDDSIQSWTDMLEKVCKQEVEKAKSVTRWAKEEIRQFEDEGMRNEILESFKRQLENIMLCTTDRVECVNNDVKEEMFENVGRFSRAVIIDNIAEDDEDVKITEVYGVMNGFRKNEETDTEYTGYKRKADLQVQSIKSKLYRKEAPKHVNFILFDNIDLEDNVSRTVKEEETQGQFVQEEHFHLFDDWDWNSDEFDFEDLIEIENNQHLHVKFYDDPQVEPDWNDFNYWKWDEPQFYEIPCYLDFLIENETLNEYDNLCIAINKQDSISWEDPKAVDLLMKCEGHFNDDERDMEPHHSPIISDVDTDDEGSSPGEKYLHFWLNELNRESIISREDINKTWTRWSLWDHFGSVKEISEAHEATFDFFYIDDKEGSINCKPKSQNSTKAKKKRKTIDERNRKSCLFENKENKKMSKKHYFDSSQTIKRQKLGAGFCQGNMKTINAGNYLKTIQVKKRLSVKMFPKQPVKS